MGRYVDISIVLIIFVLLFFMDQGNGPRVDTKIMWSTGGTITKPSFLIFFLKTDRQTLLLKYLRYLKMYICQNHCVIILIMGCTNMGSESLFVEPKSMNVIMNDSVSWQFSAAYNHNFGVKRKLAKFWLQTSKSNFSLTH